MPLEPRYVELRSSYAPSPGNYCGSSRKCIGITLHDCADPQKVLCPSMPLHHGVSSHNGVVYGLMPRAICVLFFALTHIAAQPRVELITQDIENFWKAYDQGEPGKRAAALQALYFNPGSPGLRDFLRLRIGSAQQLADAIERFPNYYATIRANTLSVENRRPQIELYLSRFQDLYPQAAFPPVYFMVGARFNRGYSYQHWSAHRNRGVRSWKWR